MDEAIGKVGVYEFFCVLLSGMIFGMICLYSGVPERYVLLQGAGEIVTIVAFLLWSTFVGLILQGVGAMVDVSKIFPLKQRVRENIFNGKYVFKTESELNSIKSMAKEIIKNRDKDANCVKKKRMEYDNDNSRYVHDYCSCYLQTKGKDVKVEQIGAMYGLFRSLTIAFPLLIVVHIFLKYYNEKCMALYSYSIGYGYSPLSFSLKMIFLLYAHSIF